MNRLISILLLLLPISLCAQNYQEDEHKHKTVHKVEITPVDLDTIPMAADSSKLIIGQAQPIPMTEPGMWAPDPMRAVWLGALVPGLGQIYNRSYWKLPIVYGGLMGCIYAITWNGQQYTISKQAYRDFYTDIQNGKVTDDPLKTYNQLLQEGYTIDKMGGQDTYLSTLQNWQNNYRRYRDISIVCTILVYGLTLIDAYVDAQLFDFDISDDLSLNIEPQLYHDLMNQKSAELKVAITIK
ncbi:MAG: DUF5683 domain-containing protein [Paludibacteraceae bacterium]|nr:DUF5683 domain-containing protein [Paludibacteraceae bacterium]